MTLWKLYANIANNIEYSVDCTDLLYLSAIRGEGSVEHLLMNNIINWCKENVVKGQYTFRWILGQNKTTEEYRVLFHHKDDLTAFRLRFGL